jgi:hypothetical protein
MITSTDPRKITGPQLLASLTDELEQLRETEKKPYAPRHATPKNDGWQLPAGITYEVISILTAAAAIIAASITLILTHTI